ncbi:MAG: ABC transporter ATP-binding protein [Rikenellaceae bacterium]|nr:ABC transporter ATP-binding protein [Rikenellaceae bacterium]MBQ2959115.1 ABC transporter ATP-binding protein [Alistipes sp.]MBR2436527.1 ABC transporter ATP-binding protein [Alistipes sp.]
MFKTYLRLLGFAKPLSRYTIPYFIFAALHAVFNTFNYAMIIPILNTMFEADFEFVPIYAFPEVSLNADGFNALLCWVYTNTFGTDFDHVRFLAMLGGVTMAMNLLSNTFRYAAAMTVETLRVTTLRRMRDEMFSKVITMNVGYFSEQRKGDIMSKITQDVMVVQYCITNTLQVAFRDPFLIIGYLSLMIGISWQLSLFAVLFLPVVGVVIGSIVKRLRHPAKRGQERMADMVSVLDESLSGIKIVKGYNAAGFLTDKFKALDLDFSRLILSMARRQQLASPMSEFLGITAVAVILVFGGSLVVGGSLQGAGFIAFIAAFSQITRPLRSFIDQFANINQGVAAGERIFTLIDAESEVKDRADAKEFEGLKESIELRDVHFSYDGTRDVINGISLKIRKGETVALVGASGGGKSTLSELIPRFWDVQSGEVLFDGVAVDRYTQESLRSKMSIVAQETVLFNDTIEGNILMGRPSATHDEVVAASKVANAHNFIMNSADGYNTNIGDRGTKLSGGQRQRISIARAVLKNPEILILDEATSALDTESEKLVQEALTNLLKGRTSIVIAHRLSTIYNADRIYVIDEGRIAEEGTHAELLAKGGIYAHLIEMQSFS